MAFQTYVPSKMLAAGEHSELDIEYVEAAKKRPLNAWMGLVHVKLRRGK